MDKYTIDIIIISYNTRNLLMNCLQSIRKFTIQPHHIIVVDNASKDDSVLSVKELGWSNLSVVENLENVGYAKACNQGICLGTSPYIALMNSDIEVKKGWLTSLITCFESDDRIAIVGPKLIDHKGRITGAGVIGTNRNHWPRGFMEPDEKGKYEDEEDCISVCGAAYLIRRELIPILGLFDENYFFYFEETDYSFQARNEGFRVVYCPRSKIYHDVGQSCKDHGLLRSYFETSRRYFYQKWEHLMETENVSKER